MEPCYEYGATGWVRYNRELSFRQDGSIEKLVQDFYKRCDRNQYKVVTYYGDNNNMTQQLMYQEGRLVDKRNFSVYSIEDFDKVANKPGITAQQKQNAIDNAGIFMSLCYYNDLWS